MQIVEICIIVIVLALTGSVCSESDTDVIYAEREARQQSLHEAYLSALDRIAVKAKSASCKLLVEQTFEKYWTSFMSETTYPFERTAFFSECQTPSKTHFGPVKYTNDRNYEKPTPVNITRSQEESLDPNHVGILYVMLVHSHPNFAVRIIKALNEPMHTFVVHVDLKSEQTYQALAASLANNTLPSNVYLLPEAERREVVWGAYSIVGATLAGIEYGFTLNRTFDFVIDISGTTFPVKSNQYIREFLARHPNNVYNNIKPEVNFPPPELWHHYVECDGAVHRIARMTPARGISMHIGSQWFSVPRHVAEWLITDPLPISYREYAKHVVIADEHYFSTMFRNSPYCSDLVNKDVNYVLFSKWETERGNMAKCVQPDPLRCGRSPTTLVALMKPSIIMAQVLFARKFDPTDEESMSLVDEIEEIRANRVDDLFSAQVSHDEDNFMIMTTGLHNLRDQQLQLDKHQNCLWMQPKVGGLVRSVPCYASDINQRFVRDQCVELDSRIYNSSEYSPCEKGCDSSFVNPTYMEDGAEFGADGDHTQEQQYMQTYCRYRGIVPGVNVEGTMEKDDYLCVDIQGQSIKPGAPIISYPCTGLWNQFFRLSADCHLSATQPDAVSRIRGNVPDPANATLCIEVMDTYTNEKGLYDIRARECTCDDPGHGTQTFKMFSTVNDMPLGMWLSNGKFHEKNISRGSGNAPRSELSTQSAENPPGTSSSGYLTTANGDIAAAATTVAEERQFGSITKSTPSVGTGAVDTPEVKSKIKETIAASRRRTLNEL